ncbi:hypothetical protein AKJ40_04180 [candidate division MSBL1 archaeon SCGC-AAA259M10]|uniref:KaiC-like domain-containing protein n=1 Tax=candidate division MSBL1 archaeon SCGC-AAA259M10 TaxID=1698270 RepID=A0A133UXT8_9EURY|nr:hypothetical protein AKJ40_04180 [candidate division MSBL1 archaeon SCGC-AAA259M10]
MVQPGNCALVIGETGSGKTVFSLQFLCEGLFECGSIGTLVSFHNDKRDLIKYAREFGWHLKRFDRNETIKILAKRPSKPSSDNGMDAVKEVIKMVEDIEADRIALDGLQTLSRFFRNERGFEEGLKFLKRELRKQKCLSIMTSNPKFGFQEIMDSVLILHQINSRFGRIREIEIKKAWGTDKGGTISFEITNEGVRFEDKGQYSPEREN